LNVTSKNPKNYLPNKARLVVLDVTNAERTISTSGMQIVPQNRKRYIDLQLPTIQNPRKVEERSEKDTIAIQSPIEIATTNGSMASLSNGKRKCSSNKMENV